MALSKLAVRRLRKLATFMARLPKKADKHFYMGQYLRFNGSGTHSISQKDLLTCGTTACALGWAAAVPEFKRAGLSMDSGGCVTLRDEDVNNHETAKNFFHISDDLAESLFDYSHAQIGGLNTKIRTPRQWAAKCRRLIKANA